MDITSFNHKIHNKVRFNEVDMFGVVNNSVYFTYFEMARIEYIKNARKTDLISNLKTMFFTIKNEATYNEPAFFDDELNIYTMVSFIKNSSFGFEHIIENAKTGKIIAQGSGIIVQVDPITKKSLPLEEDFYSDVLKIDANVKIIKD